MYQCVLRLPVVQHYMWCTVFRISEYMYHYESEVETIVVHLILVYTVSHTPNRWDEKPGYEASISECLPQGY